MRKSHNDSDIVTKLMIKEVSKTKVLSRENEQILFVKYHSTDSQTIKNEIRNIIVQSNLRFVLKIAIHYNRALGVDINDVMSEGKIGLILAVDKFNHKRDIKFISYAVWQIRCKVSKYLEENDLIRLPPNQKMRLNKLRQLDPELLTEDERIFLRLMSGAKSLDDPIGHDGDTILQDTITDETTLPPDIQVAHNRISNDLKNILDNVLNDEEKFIITSVFGLNPSGEPMNLREVNEKVGKSRERVRQIRDRALAKLKKNIDIKELSELIHEVPI